VVTRKEVLPVQLEDGTSVHIEALVLGGEEEVGFRHLPFDEVTKVIESVAGSVLKSVKKVKPKKVEVEFGILVGLESGNLTTLIVQGTGTANFKVCLEWSETKEAAEKDS
jgi:hypothetical protein